MTQTLQKPHPVEVRTSQEEDAVQRGAAWIDENYLLRRDWECLINLDTLDLTSDTSCILGQLFGDAEMVFKVWDMDIGVVQCYGFAAWPDRYDQTIECWKKVIRERRGEV